MKKNFICSYRILGMLLVPTFFIVHGCGLQPEKVTHNGRTSASLDDQTPSGDVGGLALSTPKDMRPFPGVTYAEVFWNPAIERGGADDGLPNSKIVEFKPGASITFDKIPTGSIHVHLRLMDKDRTTLFKGSATTSIIAGQTSYADIYVSPVPNQQGTLVVNIKPASVDYIDYDEDDFNGPIISYLNPCLALGNRCNGTESYFINSLPPPVKEAVQFVVSHVHKNLNYKLKKIEGIESQTIRQGTRCDMTLTVADGSAEFQIQVSVTVAANGTMTLNGISRPRKIRLTIDPG